MINEKKKILNKKRAFVDVTMFVTFSGIGIYFLLFRSYEMSFVGWLAFCILTTSVILLVQKSLPIYKAKGQGKE